MSQSISPKTAALFSKLLCVCVSSDFLFLLISFISCTFQQWRLIPYIAVMYCMDYFSKVIFADFVGVRVARLMGDKSENMVSSNHFTIPILALYCFKLCLLKLLTNP